MDLWLLNPEVIDITNKHGTKTRDTLFPNYKPIVDAIPPHISQGVTSVGLEYRLH